MPGGYYGNRRPDSYAEGPQQRMRYNSRGGSYNNAGHYNGNGNGNGVYPQHGYHQSHDTVTSGQTYGSDSTGPWHNGTDPSSENSSLDRINATTKPQQDGMYGGQNGYGGYPRAIPEDGQYAPQHQGYGGGPVQPPGGARKPIPLGGGGESGFSAPTAAPPRGNLPSTARAEPEEKKSWLKRRFSKNK